MEACDLDNDSDDCDSTSAGWEPHSGSQSCMVPSGQTDEVCSEVIDLDYVISSRGLADSDAYQFRLKATTTSGIGGPYSDEIIIIDTPITAANGHSPGTGQAKLSWLVIEDVLADAAYAGGIYSFRYRRAGGDHTQLGWRPGSYVSDEIIEESDLVGIGNDTIGGPDDPSRALEKGEVYAIQLRYEKAGKPTVYAARDVYVWPSDIAGGVGSHAGERLATFPLNYPLSNKTYSYVFCEETFPSGKENEWKNSSVTRSASGIWPRTI